MPVIEFRIADANAAYRGVSLDELMAGAGREVASFVDRLKPRPVRAVVVAGKGNNGGDGFAAALLLAASMRVTVITAEGEKAYDPGGPAANALNQVRRTRLIKRLEWGSRTAERARMALAEADVVLDCLLGSGIKGPARPPYDELIALVNSLKSRVISVDVPSGFPFDPAVRPQTTVTIEAAKEGMTAANSGRIVPVRIGFPAEAWTHTGPGELLLIPPVAPDAHKMDRGVLAVVGGGPYSGAPALAALSAYACGTGLVHVFTPASVADVVRRFDPTLVVHPLPGSHLAERHVALILREMKARKCGALAVGPGLGRAATTMRAVQGLVNKASLPMVVDADAIHAVEPLGGGALRHAVVTPHAGEFKAFGGGSAGDSNDVPMRVGAAQKVASKRKTTVLLKGRITVITDGARTKLNDAGVSGMAVGGTGDVLTGAIGALLAKRLSPFDAARASAFLCGKAGELAFEDLGHSMMPPDLIRRVPRVLSRHLPWWGGRP